MQIHIAHRKQVSVNKTPKHKGCQKTMFKIPVHVYISLEADDKKTYCIQKVNIWQ